MAKYVYTDVTAENPEKGEGFLIYKGLKVKTKKGDEYLFDLKVFFPEKETMSGYIIVGEVIINGDNFGLFKNEKGISGTIIKGKLWVNLKKMVSYGGTPNYKITFVEKDEENEEGEFPF